jgi:hypothetical protein
MSTQQLSPPFPSSPYSGLSFPHSSRSLSLIVNSYSTSSEITLDIIGIVCAVIAGTALVSLIVNIEDIPVQIYHQVVMSLLFGNLTQYFVDFSHAESNYYSALQSGDPTTIAQVQQVLDTDAARFRQSATQDASYITYIGELLVLLYIYKTSINCVQRLLHVCVHICVYDYLGLHRRS